MTFRVRQPQRQTSKFGTVTARKRGLGQGNVFTPVCPSVHRGREVCPPPPMDADPSGWADPLTHWADPLDWADPPECSSPPPPPGLGRSLPLGLGRPPPNADPLGWADSPRVGQTPQVGQTLPGWADPLGWADPPNTVSKRAVRILLECILVFKRVTQEWVPHNINVTTATT